MAAGLHLEQVLATPEFLADADPTLLADLSEPPLEISPGVLEEITDADSPRGVLAVARLPRGGAASLPVSDEGLYLYLAGVQDPGNVGAIVRSAEATGAAGVALSPGTAHPNHARALRASAGSLLRLPVATDVTPDALAERLGDVSPRWLALDAGRGDDLYTADTTTPLVLAVGAERGLPQAVAARCDAHLRIPMAEPVDSLNTAVATAIVLFEICRPSRRPAQPS